jgi:Protein of unknown function (DUF3995)
LAKVTCATFVGIAIWHVYMAVVRNSGLSWAVPSRDGRPLFRPSRRATFFVAILLLLFAALIASCAGLWHVAIPHRVLVWLSYALALALVGRAIGDFRYVGFFKRIRGSKFARLDSLIFSPLCLLLAAGVLLSANLNAA